MKKVLKNKPKTQKKSYGDELKEFSEEIKTMYFYQGLDPYSIHNEIFKKIKEKYNGRPGRYINFKPEIREAYVPRYKRNFRYDHNDGSWSISTNILGFTCPGPCSHSWDRGSKGRSMERIKAGFTSDLKEEIKKRDGYKCRLCGTNEKNSVLHVHHKDRNHTNSSPSNLITLCEECHDKVHNQSQIRSSFKKSEIEQARIKFSNAYAPWSEEEDTRLKEEFNKGKTINKLVKIFKREPNAFYFRLQKLGII